MISPDLFDVYEPDTTLTAVEYDCDEGSGLFENEGNDLWVTTGNVPLPSDED